MSGAPTGGRQPDDTGPLGVDPRVLAQALARVARADYDAWAAQVAATGGCARPVRLSGSATRTDTATGEIVATYTSAGQPDRTHLHACGARRRTVCAACARTYHGDARRLILDGLTGAHDAQPAVFATLTAPSFGAVHTARTPPGPCHPQPTCGHGHGTCAARHSPDDPAVGAPLCPRCYDHAGLVLFNASITRLWHDTLIRLRRHLAHTLGVPVRGLPGRHLAYVKTVEYQRRGAIHLHLLLRLDRPGSGPDAVGHLAGALLHAARTTTTVDPLGGPPIGWGPQTDVSPLPPGPGRAGAASYLAKYTTKSVDASGGLDHRLHHRPLPHPHLPQHLWHLAATSWDLADTPALADLHLDRWAHTLGYRGHWLTKSRTWSTTLTALRTRRHHWQLTRHGHDPHTTTSTSTWAWTGTGHRSIGDTHLAATHARSRAQQRRTAWEEQ